MVKWCVVALPGVFLAKRIDEKVIIPPGALRENHIGTLPNMLVCYSVSDS
jgi:hypothetical protein